MEKYKIKNDITVFGFEVKTFPNGIGEAFDSLMQKVPDGFGRDYFGISYEDKNKMVYLATAEEKERGEDEKYDCERYTIKKGDYAIETVRDWRKKTDSIKHVFEKMFESLKGAATGPNVEWYKDDKEMLCMVK